MHDILVNQLNFPGNSMLDVSFDEADIEPRRNIAASALQNVRREKHNFPWFCKGQSRYSTLIQKSSLRKVFCLEEGTDGEKKKIKALIQQRTKAVVIVPSLVAVFHQFPSLIFQ